MLTDKDLEVLHYIVDKNQAISLQQFSEHFSLSERSIRYYIQNINFEINDAITIIKRVCHVQNPNAVNAYLQTHLPLQFTSEMKRRFMLYHLIFDGYINLTTFSKELAISRSSAKGYIEDIKEELSFSHLQLNPEHKKGLVLRGSEEQIRHVQLQYMLAFANLSKTNQQVLQPIIDRYCIDIQVDNIAIFLTHIQNALSFVLTDISYDMMFYYCMILIHRSHNGYVMDHVENEYFLITCAEYEAISKHIHLLGDNYPSLHYEILQMTSLLIGAHYAKSTNIRENNWFEHDLLVAKIISLYSDAYGVNLNQDRALYESLLTHLRPTMYRMMNNIPFMEINYQEVKQMFAKEYETMYDVLQTLNFFTNEQQDRNEIALLTLHFKAALQRNQKKEDMNKRILIVCGHGYGTSRLLEQQIMDTYEVEVLDCIPHHQLKHYDKLSQIDIIITTIHSLPECVNMPILQVHPILTTLDLQNLDQALHAKRKQRIRMSLLLDAIQKSCTIHELHELKNDLRIAIGDRFLQDDVHNQTLLDILPVENIMLDYETNHWEDAIQLAGDLLVENGYVNEQYRMQMRYSFENYGSYMMIDEGIAIPHAKNEGNVYKTGMTLVTLKKPVPFTNGKELQVFFSFCSKDNIEHLDALMAVANLIRETDFKKELRKFTAPIDVLDFFKHHHIH